MIKSRKKKIVQFYNDKDGSEAVEMVTTTAMLVFFIIIAISIFSYVIQLNNVNYATKQVARQVEVSGTYNQSRAQSLFDSCTSTSLENKKVSISNVSFVHGNKIQLKDTFRITGKCTYVIQLINPGSFTGYKVIMPITCVVTGMSEVYWQ